MFIWAFCPLSSFPQAIFSFHFKYFSKYTNIEMSTFKGEGGGSQEINPRPLKHYPAAHYLIATTAADALNSRPIWNDPGILHLLVRLDRGPEMGEQFEAQKNDFFDTCKRPQSLDWHLLITIDISGKYFVATKSSQG